MLNRVKDRSRNNRAKRPGIRSRYRRKRSNLSHQMVEDLQAINIYDITADDTVYHLSIRIVGEDEDGYKTIEFCDEFIDLSNTEYGYLVNTEKL